MPKQSAGLLVYRMRAGNIKVFLVHPGGPFWKNKDAGTWSIPKGEYVDSEDPLAAAIREFREETGIEIAGEFVPLAPVKQRGGKVVHAWAVRGDFDAAQVTSNTFSLEWPPRSGKMVEFPEIDRAEWFTLDAAFEKINIGQRPLIDEMQGMIRCGTITF
jgi:predicted NUDIX family NTP pyrophosphohydrolase